MPTYIKDPDAVLDYVADFAALRNGRGSTDYLVTGETISSHTVTTSGAALVVDSSALTDSSSSVTLWLSGGVIGVDYNVTIRIVTSASRTDDRTITISVKST